MPLHSTDVVIIGSGPTGSAYARIIRRDWPEARITIVEAGPQILPQTGGHLDNVLDLEKRATRTSTTHPWGPAPFHYTDDVYEELAARISRDLP